MNEQKKHTIYTEADIQKYLSGSMTNPEMYAIEKAAMDDPLLAEAMEGYEAMEQKDWSKELAALKDKLEASGNASVVPVYSFRKWWRAAAAVTILTTGIAVTYLFNKDKTKEIAAITKVAAVTDSESVAKTDSINTVNSIAANEIAKDNEIKLPATATETPIAKKESILLAEVKKEKESDSSFIYKPSASPAYNHNKDIATADNANDGLYKKRSEITDTNKGYSNIQSNEADNKSLSVQNQLNKASDNFFNAQVVTADDKPVAFANVSVQKNKSPVYTDAKGNFKIPVTDSAINGVVTSAGYIPQKFSFKNSATENKIVLQQDSIGLTAITSSRSKSVARPQLQKNIQNADTTGEDAEPSGGWVEYNNYITDNLVFPSEAKQKNIHGVVEVFVKLKTNGDISEVKVNKPLCPECDAEALRLVKEGPKWEVKKNKAKKAKVKIKF
jgi:Gram-negative bacterial TonB protein C-terminal/CarboxypepD_reg-like domain